MDKLTNEMIKDLAIRSLRMLMRMDIYQKCFCFLIWMYLLKHLQRMILKIRLICPRTSWEMENM